MTAFKRVNILMGAISALLNGAGSAPGAKLVAQNSAKELAMSYESHGHGGKVPQRPSGIAGVKRMARKAKGRAQNRRNHKGA